MMGYIGVKTVKELKAQIGKSPQFLETSMFGPEYKGDGKYPVVGPDPYNNRSWYATVEVKNGLVVKVS